MKMAETEQVIQVSIDSDGVTLHIPYMFFKQWKAIHDPPLLYLLNSSLPNGVVHVTDPTDRVKTRLYNAFHAINRKITSIRGGRQRQEVLNRTYN
jgi:hypothetical protein